MRSASLVLFSLLVVAVDGLNNGAARTPPMGWSTWNKLKCNFNETVLLEVAYTSNPSPLALVPTHSMLLMAAVAAAFMMLKAINMHPRVL